MKSLVSLVITSCLFLAATGFLFSSSDKNEPYLFLYTRSDVQNARLVTVANFKQSAYNPAKKTIIIIHGYNSHVNKTYWLAFKDTVMRREDANVIAVDWAKSAGGLDYTDPVEKVPDIGKKVAQFIIGTDIDPLNIHCIGHSLGAHVCGFIGKEIKLKRISALDPAGPGYYLASASERLDKTDAYFVDCIHTSAKFGLQKSIGHKDFYPNGGSSQPGCTILPSKQIQAELMADEKFNPIDWIKCSHDRARDLYEESLISSCPFTSIPCDKYENFEKGKCQCNPTYGCSSMGYNADSSAEQGDFYLATNNDDAPQLCKN